MLGSVLVGKNQPFPNLYPTFSFYSGERQIILLVKGRTLGQEKVKVPFVTLGLSSVL